MSAPFSLPRQWQAFLSDVDAEIEALFSEPIQLHCLGGFVVAAQYGFSRPTGDLDYLSVAPGRAVVPLQDRAGAGSPLHKKHRLHVEHVTIAILADRYVERVIEILPGRFSRLRLFGLEAHDLALSKLERNSPVDRGDIRHLAKTGHLDPKILRERYTWELRPKLPDDPKKHDATLEMWIESFFAN